MTTRKAGQSGPPPRNLLPVALAIPALLLGGCATPGALHVYSLASTTADIVKDTGPGSAPEVSSFIAADERITGFAYDPFTDHFFLRLAPGNVIRVVDRPARAVKREFEVRELSAAGGGDLAVKPRTGHLFLLDPADPRVSELTRLGKFVRSFALEGLTRPAEGIAYDSAHDHLLVLERGAPATVLTFDLEGRRTATLTLEHEIRDSLAFDADAREIYAPMAGSAGEVGVFDERGRLRRKFKDGILLDVGMRSFVRMF